jgi:hypothetical protein
MQSKQRQKQGTFARIQLQGKTLISKLKREYALKFSA